MTYEEAKKAIIEKCTFTRKMDERYRLGKISGMIVAFRIAGVISNDEACRMHQEVLDEIG